MTQALAVLFGAAFTAATSVSLGLLLLRRVSARLHREEEYPLAFVAGAPLLSLIVFLLCVAKAAVTVVFFAAGVVIIAAAASQGAFRPARERFSPLPSLWRWLFTAVFGVFFVLYFFHAMAPETSPDGTAYRLGLVSRYLREHGFERLTTHMYANLSQGVEMLYLFAFAFGRHSAAAMVHLCFLVAAPLLMLGYARRFGFAVAGVAGALFFFVSPVVGIDGSTAYNDVAVATVLFALFYLLQVWSEDHRDGLLVPTGLLAGFAYASKYTAGLAVPFAGALLVWRLWRSGRPLWKPVAVFGLCAAAMMAPWLIKNIAWVDNPFSPFFNKLFPNPYIHISFEQNYSANMRHYNGLENYWEIPMEAAVRGARLCGLLGPLFLLAPAAALRRRHGRLLLLAALVFGATYAANIGTRFLIPALPFLALAMAMTFARIPRLALSLVLAHAIFSWPSVIPAYADRYAWHIHELRWKGALRITPEEEFLRQHFPGIEIAEMINEQVPPGERVLTFSMNPEAYVERDMLVVYQAAFNEVLGDMLWTPFNPAAQPTRHIRFEFPPQPLRRIRVKITASGTKEDWSIAEFRLYHGGQELPRAAEWRLRARPNPWDVQRAFDNSPVTRWRSWQPPSAGMFVEVDLGAETTVDTVVLESTVDQESIALRVEGSGQDEAWRLLSDAPAIVMAPVPVGMRRLVAEEFKRAGVRHFLVQEADVGAEDYRRHMRAWNISQVAESRGFRLYRFN